MEGEREERNIHWLPFTRALMGIEPTTEACALVERETHELLVCKVMPKQLNHTGQGWS